MGNTQEELLQEYYRWLRTERGNCKKTISLMKEKSEQFIHWLEENGITDILKVNQSIVDKYLDECYNRYSPNTMKPITSNLRKLLIHYLKMEIKVKIARGGAPKRDKTPFTDEQTLALFDAAETILEEAILKTLLFGGMRKEELVGLDISDIDFARTKIQIRHAKWDKARTIDISEDCAHSIRRWLEVRPEPKSGHEQALFLSSYRRRISGQTVYNILKRTAARAGMTVNAYVHKCRITNITKMAEAGMNIVDIQVQSGIEDIKTLFGYIQRADSKRKQAYNEAFGLLNEPNMMEKKQLDADTGYYRRFATKQYLDGKIDTQTLGKLLANIDSLDEKKPAQKHNPAYG